MEKTIEEINAQEIDFLESNNGLIYSTSDVFEKAFTGFFKCKIKHLGNQSYYIEYHFNYYNNIDEPYNKIILFPNDIKNVVFK